METTRDPDNLLVTHIVSLGCRCATAYNLRRFFNFQTAFPFDWWITHTESAIRLLKASLDVDSIYDPEKLELTDGARSVRHKDYRVLLAHEFPRRWNIAGEPVFEDFFRHIEQPKRRTRYLAAKLFSLDLPSERILFVHEPEAFPLSEVDEAALRSELARLFVRADLCLAIIQGPATDDSVDWRGDPDAWDNVLKGLNVTLDRRRHNPFFDRSASNNDYNVAY